MSFKLKRLVKRAVATILVTMTFISVVPIGVFTPFVSYAENITYEDEDYVRIQIDKDTNKNDADSFSHNKDDYGDKALCDANISGIKEKLDVNINDAEGMPDEMSSLFKNVPFILYHKFEDNKSNSNRYLYLFPEYLDHITGLNNNFLAMYSINDHWGQLHDTSFFKGAGLVSKESMLKLAKTDKVNINLDGWKITADYARCGGDWAKALCDTDLKMDKDVLEIILRFGGKNLSTDKVVKVPKNGNAVNIKFNISSDGNIDLFNLDNGKLQNKIKIQSDRFTIDKNLVISNYVYDGEKKESFDFKEYIKEKGLKCDILIGSDKVNSESSFASILLSDSITDNDLEIQKLGWAIGDAIAEYLDNNYRGKGDIDIEAPANPDDTNAALSSLNDGEALGTWMLVVNNFFNTGNISITQQDRDYLGIKEDDDYDKVKNMDITKYGWGYILPEFTENGTIKKDDSKIDGDISALNISDEAKRKNYMLSPYDDLQLRMYYSIQAQYRYIADTNRRKTIYNLRTSGVKLDEKFAINNAFTLTDTELGTPNYFFKDMKDNEDTPPALFKDEGTIRADAQKAAQSEFPDTTEKTTPNVKALASNFNPVVKYLTYGAMLPSNSKDYAESAASTTAAIPYSENTMKIIPSLKLDGGVNVTDSSDEASTIMSADIDFSKFGFPDLTNITQIGNSEFARNKASQLYLSLMYLKKYASLPKEYDDTEKQWNVKNEKSMAGLKIDSDNIFEDYSALDSSDIINPDIQNFLSDMKDKTEDEKKQVSPDTEVGVYIRAYISIHDGMDYIGLSKDDKWVSPELKRIYDYYDDIKYWKDVVSQTEYDPSDLKESQPFGEFFQLPRKDDNNEEVKPAIGDYIRKGIAASATYLPLVTNTFDYDAVSIIDDADFVNDFHYKYGFHRKALFIDSNSSAALQAYVTGQKDSLRVATLEDFMQPDKDIVLYIDPNFYNIKSLAEKQNLSYNKLQNTEDAGKEEKGLIQGVADMWSEWRNLDAASICKTSGVNLYSDALGNNAVQAYGTDAKSNNFWGADSKNHYVLSTDGINSYYNADEYSDVQSFAFVSGIYRCSTLLNICQRESANPKPVFVSSATLPFVEGVSKKEFNSIYNYLMVKNLKANLGLDYKTELDLDSPLFIDVYGNISTQSGLVVIPAASNATLYEPDSYSIVTAGLASLAGNVDSWQIPSDAANVSKYLDSGFVKDPNTETYKLQNKSTATVELNFNNLPLQSEGVKKALYNDAYVNSGSGAITGNNTFNSRVNMIMEVMRGAPIENIDFDFEGLSGYRNIDKTGIYIAYRIEQLGDMLLSSSEGNSLLKMPNLAFMEGVEYIVVIIFKILLAAGVFLLWFKLYADGATNSIGIRTGVDFMLSISSVVIGIVLIPTLINFSYYQTNKQLLQNEAAYLLMLNTEKNAEGKEVGVKEVKAPSSTTKFYIKLNEIKVPWWTVIQDVYSSEMFAKMEDVYDEAYSSSIYSTFPGAMKRGNGIYVNTDDLFKSSEIRFVTDEGDESLSSSDDDKVGHLEQAVLPNNRMSYVLPYYAIIDKLLYDAECYNDAYSSSAYRTKVLQNGNVRTIGLLEAYFKSNQFLQSDEMNLFGFYDIYGVPYSGDIRKPFFNEDSVNSMSKSLWYNKDAFTDEEVELKLQKLDELGKQFIVDNRTLLNKITDETFIKVFALYMSIQHNNLFKVPAARGIELMEIDTKDIIRLSLAPKSDVMHSISMSFGRFTFTQAGTFGTILMAFLLLIYYFTSLIKPIVMIILVGGLIFSYVWKKLMRYEQNHSLEGYIVSCALICLVNLIYALVIKISVMLPDFGVDPIFSILMQIVLQAAYVGILYLIGYVVLKNNRDLGYFTYKTFYDAHMANKIQSITMSANKLVANSIFAPFSNTANNMRNDYLSNRRTAGLTGDDIYSRMQQNDEVRRTDVYNNYNRRY